MPVLGYSLSERISRWQVLVSNLKEEPDTLPHHAGELAQLEALLPQVRALQDRYEHHRAQARQVNAELTRLAAVGDNLRGRLGASLIGKLGFDNEALIRYGYRPRRRRGARKGAPPEPEPAPPVAAAEGEETAEG